MAWDPTQSKWFLLAGSGLLLYNSSRGLITGRAILFIRDVTRSEDGYGFWWAVLTSATLGIAGVFIVLLGR